MPVPPFLFKDDFFSGTRHAYNHGLYPLSKKHINKIVEVLFDELDGVRIHLLDQRIENYNYEGNYSTDDNFIHLFDTILKHNKIIFVTPVYWYSMSGS
jgi:NAD(P)H-dependent FMN reductase